MENRKQQIFTIPNLLSLIRLLMIPAIVVIYQNGNYLRAAAVVALSGLTDVVDGFIARRFNMVSDLGKALDPIADKLTQAAMLLCLIGRFPHMLIPFGLLMLKETITGVWSLVVIRNTKKVTGADWHGKVTTVLLYAMMLLHLLWGNIPEAALEISIWLCTSMMLYSFVLYSIRNYRALRASRSAEAHDA